MTHLPTIVFHPGRGGAHTLSWLRVVLSTAACISSLIASPQAAPAQEVAADDLNATRVTPEMLNAKIAELEASPGPPDAAGEQLIQHYRQALSNLQEAKANRERAAAFEAAMKSAPAQAAALRDQVAKAERASRGDDLPAGPEVSLEEFEQELRKAEAERAAATARFQDIDRRIQAEVERPAQIRQLLEAGTGQQKEIAASLRAPSGVGEQAAPLQARHWALETQSAVLSAELGMLNQELVSRPVRLDLLTAEREQAEAEIKRAEARVAELSERVQVRRQTEVQEARADAAQTRLQIEGLDPVFIDLADRNAELTEQLNDSAARFDLLRSQQANTAELANRLAADYKDASETLDESGLTSGLGDVLLESKQYVPNVKECRRNVRALEEETAQAKILQLKHREEARRLGDTERAVSTLAEKFADEATPEMTERLKTLVEQRCGLLEKALVNDEAYLAQLRDTLAAERDLAEAAQTYGDFLNENLLWLGNVDPLRLSDLRTVPDELRTITSPDTWLGLAQVVRLRVVRAPLVWGVLLVAGILQWKRRAMRAAIKTTATLVGKPRNDQFAYTLRTLALSLGLAAPLPLLLASLGWLLRGGTVGNDPSLAVGASLVHVATNLVLLRFWSKVCLPEGLAIVHFRWREDGVVKLRRQLGWLTLTLVPMMLFARFAIDLNPTQGGGTTARLGLVCVYGILGWFFYAALHPRRGMLAVERTEDHTPFVYRMTHIWFILFMAWPVGSIALTLGGFMYSLGALSVMFQYSVWLLGGVVLFRAFALRWLLVVRRRLVFDAAVERRRAAARAAEAGGEAAEEGADDHALHVDEPGVNLVALGEASREFLGFVTIIAGLVGLYLIWSPALPALRIFDDIDLWKYTITVNGQAERLPVTLADLVLAILVAIGTSALARRLPALLEIILLRRFNLTSGSRYAVTTLFNYIIIFIGAMVVLGIVGIKWSQLQWLVAALGVGIGFGLQEIVANFICGLIILFERPVRVGDIVTVGETDGVVTRIRIRATTIRNWDRKELLVPNKEFITGRLLNWTLSDQVTRIVVTVGVAYGTDVDRAMALMKEAAEEHEYVLDDPPPMMTFESFGDNALTLILRAYLGSLEFRMATITELHRAINRKFNEAGIAIAFPQRDVHLDASRPLRVQLDAPRESASRPPNDAGHI